VAGIIDRVDADLGDVMSVAVETVLAQALLVAIEGSKGDVVEVDFFSPHCGRSVANSSPRTSPPDA